MPLDIPLLWDESSRRHIARHGVTDVEVTDATHGRVSVRKIRVRGEKRLQVIGKSDGRILFMVFRREGVLYRPITARDANRREKRLYHLRAK
ncbi:MAG: BrnT family toxin [Euryarchaeota archaeon]|nr:BrnT family toxin [Euryarchaeota archaeon]